MYVTEGFWSVEVMPLPKFHDQDVGAPVEVLVSCTDSGAVPDVAEAVKFAEGVGAGVVTQPGVVKVLFSRET